MEVCLHTPYQEIYLTLPLLCRWTPSSSGIRFAEALHVATLCLPSISQCRCFLVSKKRKMYGNHANSSLSMQRYAKKHNTVKEGGDAS